MYSSVSGVCSTATVFFCFGFFCLYCITTIDILGDPGSVSRVKRRDESFLADWLPLGLQGCITTVPALKGRSQRWSFWSGRDLDQSQKKCHFFCRNSIHCKVFQFQLPGRKPLLPLWEISSKMLDNFPIKLSHLHLTSRDVTGTCVSLALLFLRKNGGLLIV